MVDPYRRVAEYRSEEKLEIVMETNLLEKLK
jgi:hypothetical protein